MKRTHRMPFGAEYLGNGDTRFRLWAPTAAAIELALERNARAERCAMRSLAGGWFEAIRPAQPGTRYRFHLDDGLAVPDPASRHNPQDVHGPSEVIDPGAFEWDDARWTGRPWHEAVIYELHVGAFTPAGTFDALLSRLDHFAELGVTAVELMPLGDFPGRRNWGYDGVLPFAPDSSYGRPEDLKRFIAAAHARGLMVLIDVVYNHFGPEGNYLGRYASHFFSERHRTPWGHAINFDGNDAGTVRDFFIHNALYWLEEYHADGLRVDAVHAIVDESAKSILCELAERVRAGPGRERHVHLVLEDDANRAAHLARDSDGHPRWYDAQWNDDLHHCMHVLLTGETSGYYGDYAQHTTQRTARCLAEGYAYQGERSAHRGGALRGKASTHLPPTAFVSFLQNHDQIGNRAHGTRLIALTRAETLRAALAALLWSPHIPLLFMGEEFGARTPFLFFCDFGAELANAVTEGRRREFADFLHPDSAAPPSEIPDPNAETTFLHSKLDWACLQQPEHARWLALYRELLAVRREHIVPLIDGIAGNAGRYRVLAEGVLSVTWHATRDLALNVRINVSSRDMPPRTLSPVEVIACEPSAARAAFSAGGLPRYAAACCLQRGGKS
ncbi:MAG TPA: malto-oligosyltrehalose trehalohydrolase [Burkholderiales bacterium]|nr:malto-oligosyltrehalose trehalohydrolase [Burkholderiales bacterium]